MNILNYTVIMFSQEFRWEIIKFINFIKLNSMNKN